MLERQLKTLTPPNTPAEAIQSRRNPCYGFAIVVDLRKHEALMSLFANTRDEILQIVDPDRAIKQHPIRSPLYIKQRFFHAAVFGTQFLLDQYANIYTSEHGLLNQHNLEVMCDTLRFHLKECMPCLEPMQCELIEKDGTILARFAYKTFQGDDAPLLSLAKQLDPEQQLAKWDANNPLHYTTVAIVLCVIDRDNMGDKLEAIQTRLTAATLKLHKLGVIPITDFQVIKSYDKCTLSEKHILESEVVSAHSSSLQHK